MEVVEKYSHEVTCPHCNSKLRYNKYDISWYWGEPDYFYVMCPVCNKMVFIEKTKETVRMYNEVIDEKDNV